MHQTYEIFEDNLRQAFVNRALRRNNFDQPLKEEIEDSIKFRLECLGRSPEKLAYISDFIFNVHQSAKRLKPEEVIPDKQDVLISIMQLQSINDVVTHISTLKSKLSKQGVLIVVFPGNKSFSMLRKLLEQVEIEILGGASPRFFPMIDVKDAGAIAYKSGFQNVISDVDEMYLNLKSTKDIASFVRNTALGNCVLGRSKKFLTKKFIRSLDYKITENIKHKSLFQLDLVTVTAYNA